MLRTSERGTLKSCEWRWHLEFNLKRKPIIAAPALRFGMLTHQSLAAYYIPGKKRGEHPARAFERFYAAEMERVQVAFGSKVEVNPEEDPKWIDALELGIAMLEHYVDEYGSDDEWEVVATEQPFEITVYDPTTYDPNHPAEAQATAKPWFQYVGVVDGVWRNRLSKELWIPDHKTTAGIGGTPEYPKMPIHLRLDDQAGAYWSYGVDWLRSQGILADDAPLAGMLYNYLRKALPDERPSKIVGGQRIFTNKDGSLSKKQPSPYFARFRIHRDEADRFMAKQRAMTDYRRIELFRQGQLELSKSPGQMTCGGCWALDVCELHETGNDWQSMMAETTALWDPYEEHEVLSGR